MRTRSRMLVGKVACFLLLLLIAGCASEQQDWEKAQAAGTIDAYESFIANHADSPLSQNALQEVWRMVKEKNSIDTLELFMRNHPNSQFSQNAMEEVWRLVNEKNAISVYEDFLNNHPNSSYASLARDNIKSIWTSLVPSRPSFELQSNVTVDLNWPEVAGAQRYVVYWSTSRNFKKSKANSDTTESTYYNSKIRVGEYGAKLPMYYRITALKDSMESRLSDACLAKLFADKGGRYCELCGRNAVGYCHLREIYVCETHNTFESDDGTYWQCP